MDIREIMVRKIMNEQPSFNKGDLELMDDGRLRADHYRESFAKGNQARIEAIRNNEHIEFIADLIGGMRASGQKEFCFYSVPMGVEMFQDALFVYQNDVEKYGDNTDFEISSWFLINKNVE